MELNINSPEYYSSIYGVEDEVYWMCREISSYVRNKKYSPLVNVVGLSPIIAPKKLIERGEWREYIIYDLKKQFVIVNKHIDHNKYISTSIEGKKKLIIDNILSSINMISQKTKINYKLFEKDILELVSYSKEELLV